MQVSIDREPPAGQAITDALGVDTATVVAVLAEAAGEDVLDYHIRTIHRRTCRPGGADTVAKWNSCV